MNYTEAINSTPVVLVEFYATWCPHCQRMMPVIEQIKELLEGQVDIYQLDIDQNAELSDLEKVNATPTFVIYKDGKPVWRESGEMDGQFLLDKIQSFM
ncbi:MAG: thioredoxin family protein [Bacteroides sp.]|nr:thioredoxin family protein [Bacteroidales bacterium]MBD5306001.1 thioredoxin family protein [Bacteroides sp.]MBD5349018.1 thioredoxin family protein [Bacteroides sp.]